MVKRSVAAALCLWMATTGAVAAQDSTNVSPTPSWTIPTSAAIHEILVDRIDQQHQSVGIVVGVIDGKGRRIVSYGHLNQGDTRPLNGDTVFEIGSITKVFTSLLLSDMTLHGEAAFDDPVSKYLPRNVRVPERGGKEITLIDLATHTSGLPRMPNNFSLKDQGNPYTDYTVDQLYQFLGGYSLTREIGVQYEYSNLDAGLLGQAIAQRAGVPYETLVRDRITRPLGMRDTAIVLSPDMSARLAIGHDGTMNPVKNWDLPTLEGAGALRSTANDMLRFLGAELGFARTPLKAAMDKQLSVRRPTGTPNLAVALGWHELSGRLGTVIWHNGGTGGYRTFVGFEPRTRVGVVVLSNAVTITGPDDIGFHVLVGQPLAATPALQDTVGVSDVSGTWRMQARYDNENAAAPVCVFQQAGSRLSGTCKGPNSLGTATGSVSGPRVVIRWSAVAFTPTGGSGDAVFSGTLDSAQSMSGTAEFSGTRGTFAAMRE